VQDENSLVAATNVFEAQDAGAQPFDADGDGTDDTITTVGDLAIAFT